MMMSVMATTEHDDSAYLDLIATVNRHPCSQSAEFDMVPAPGV
jgi:hypothetical protein